MLLEKLTLQIHLLFSLKTRRTDFSCMLYRREWDPTGCSKNSNRGYIITVLVIIEQLFLHVVNWKCTCYEAYRKNILTLSVGLSEASDSIVTISFFFADPWNRDMCRKRALSGLPKILWHWFVVRFTTETLK